MIRRLEDADVTGQTVLVRVDFNVPMEGGQISDDTRLQAAIPTIQYLIEKGAKVVLASHFGRPKGERQTSLSLYPLVKPLSELLGVPVAFAKDCIGESAERAASKLDNGEVLLLENTRFHPGEEANEDEFAQSLARLADLYVNDAFSASHRAHGSTEGVAHHLPSYAGLALQREIDHITAALESPKHPVLAIVGGAKVSTKIELLKNLITKVDQLFIGGAMANTFLAAQGHEIGKSLFEADHVETALEILNAAGQVDCEIILPSDGVVTEKFVAGAARRVSGVEDIGPSEMILDCGPETVDHLADVISRAKTLVWNGPLGAFELTPFDTATVEAAQFAAKQATAGNLIVVAGGGDTVAALNHAGVAEDFTFVSTAGGAFLEWLEGRELPGIAVLKD